MMQLKYDLNVGALYVKLSNAAAVRTREIDDNTSVDLDRAGSVVGIEVISISHPWALSTVLDDYDISPDDAAQLRAYFERTPGFSWRAPALAIEPNAPICVPA